MCDLKGWASSYISDIPVKPLLLEAYCLRGQSHMSHTSNLFLSWTSFCRFMHLWTGNGFSGLIFILSWERPASEVALTNEICRTDCFNLPVKIGGSNMRRRAVARTSPVSTVFYTVVIFTVLQAIKSTSVCPLSPAPSTSFPCNFNDLNSVSPFTD